jgi:hypothetical protein
MTQELRRNGHFCRWRKDWLVSLALPVASTAGILGFLGVFLVRATSAAVPEHADLCMIDHPDWALPALPIFDLLPADHPALTCCDVPAHLDREALHEWSDPPRFIGDGIRMTPPPEDFLLDMSRPCNGGGRGSTSWTMAQPPDYVPITVLAGGCSTEWPCYPGEQDCTEGLTLRDMREIFRFPPGVVPEWFLGEHGRPTPYPPLDYPNSWIPYGIRCCSGARQRKAGEGLPSPNPGGQ